MLEQYRPILFAASLYIALWALAVNSNPAFPQGVLAVGALILGALWIFYGGIHFHKEKKRLASLFLWATALAPFLFYIEAHFILSNNQNIDAEVFAGNFTHAIVVYNLMRYCLLLCSFVIITSKMLSAIKHFAQDREPY